MFHLCNLHETTGLWPLCGAQSASKKTNIEPRMWQYYLGEPSSHLVVVQVHWIISVLSGTMIFFSLDMGFAFTAHNASAVMIILGLIECVIYDHGTLLSIVSDKELI